jgi:hypothetical protein
MKVFGAISKCHCRHPRRPKPFDNAVSISVLAKRQNKPAPAADQPILKR